MNSLTSEELLGLGGIIGAFIAFFIIFTLAWAILQIVATWKVFTKAGEAGWKAIIPIYSNYTQFKFTWSTDKFWIYLIASFTLVIGEELVKSTNEVVAAIGSIISFVSLIILLIYAIKLSIYLSRAFSKGNGFACGLFFLAPIFMLILGFGSSTYVGNKSKK